MRRRTGATNGAGGRVINLRMNTSDVMMLRRRRCRERGAENDRSAKRNFCPAQHFLTSSAGLALLAFASKPTIGHKLIFFKSIPWSYSEPRLPFIYRYVIDHRPAEKNWPTVRYERCYSCGAFYASNIFTPWRARWSPDARRKRSARVLPQLGWPH
jgi:hypothetical protein